MVSSGEEERLLTHAKGKHVGQRPRRVEYDVELAGLQRNVPCRCRAAKGLLDAESKEDESTGIEETEDGPDYKLGILKAGDGNDGLAQTGEQDGSYKGPWHSTRKGEVVVAGSQPLSSVARYGRAVDKKIMGSLDVEGLLHLCVRCHSKMEEDQGRYGQK